MPNDLLRGRQTVTRLTNKSGGGVVAGDVVILSSGTAAAFTTTTSAAQVADWVGVALETIANDGTGRVCLFGYVPIIALSASASLGDYVSTHTVAKQGAPAGTDAAGSFGQVLGTGATPAAILWGRPTQAGGGSAFTWSVSTTEAGAAQDRNTAGTYASQTQSLYVFQPLKITAFKIDIYAAGTYKLGLTVHSGTALWAQTITAAKVVAAQGEATFTPDDTEFVLLPGFYYLTIEKDGAEVQWYDRDVTTYNCALYRAEDIWYETAAFNYTAPIRIVAYTGTVNA